MRKLNLLFSYSLNAFKDQDELNEFERFIHEKRKEYLAGGIDLNIRSYYNYEQQQPPRRKELFLACQSEFDIILLMIDFQLDDSIKREILNCFSAGVKTGRRPYDLLFCLRPPESIDNTRDSAFFDAFREEIHRRGFNTVSYDHTDVLLNYVDRHLDRHTGNLSFTHSTSSVLSTETVENELPNVQMSRLPDVGGRLFGRSEQLARLDEAWAASNCTIVQVTGFGGVGKTALVMHWLRQITGRDFIGVKNVFFWSFYSQGSGEKRILNSESFFESALKFFGVKNPPESLYDRIKYLADAIRAERTILILDGLESLQAATGEDRGKIRDFGLTSFLKEIAAFNQGLCLITSRIEIKGANLEYNPNTPLIKLDHLQESDGIELLRFLGVKGTTREIGAAVREYNGHPLSLKLLGSYLVYCKNADVRKRKEIPKKGREKNKEHNKGYKEHNQEYKVIMNAYVQWLSSKEEVPPGKNGQKSGKIPPELVLLYTVGLFDRPMPIAVLNNLLKESLFLLKKDKLQVFFSTLRDLNADEQSALLNDLVELGLLYRQTSAEDSGKPLVYNNLPGFNGIESIDAHPLVREYFSEIFERDFPEQWRLAHSNLFSFFQSVPKKHHPDHIFEVEILFHSVVHGCKANEYQRAFANVYWERINRKQAFYCVTAFGAYDLNIAALYWFFQTLWTRPVAGLQRGADAVLLCNAGITLLDSGRIDDALLPLQLAYDSFTKYEDRMNRARMAVAQSSYYLLKGSTDNAMDFIKQSIEDANCLQDPQLQVLCHTNCAGLYHLRFEKLKAMEHFRHVTDTISKNPNKQLESGWFVYQYADFHMEISKPEGLINLSRWLLEKEEKSSGLIDKALVKLSLGKVYLQISGLLLDNHENLEYQKTMAYEAMAGQYLDDATKELYLFGNQHYLTLALLANVRWLLLRIKGGFSESKTKDIEDAFRLLGDIREILESCKIVLYMVDLHILYANICLYNERLEEAREYACKALAGIKKSGYERKRSALDHHLLKALNITEAGAGCE